MIRRADLEYRTPAGYVDDFFGYVYDADDLPDGGNYRDVPVKIEADSDFVLRKVDGMGTILKGVGGVGGQWHLMNARGAHVSERPIYAQDMSVIPPLPAYDSEAVLPERIYPALGAIRFDLLGVQKLLYYNGNGSVSVPASQFVFTGVKRYPGSVKDSAYQYRLLPYAYTIQFVIDWDVYIYLPPHVPNGRTPARQFYIPINDMDFELWGVNDAGAPAGAVPPVASHAKVQLYDAAGRGRYSKPVLADWFAYNSPYSVANAIAPGILYPVGSQIKFDLYSMMFGPPLPFTELGFPLEREWTFFGVQRVPLASGGGA